MLIDEQTLRTVMRLTDAATVEVEELSGPSRAERVFVRGPEGGEQSYIVREDADAERAINHAAVVEALTNAGFATMPRVVALSGAASIEEEFPGLPLLSLRADMALMEAAIDAIATLHGLDVHEGLDFEREPGELLLGPEPQLHRLGFASPEREPALEAFRSAHAALLKTPFGFAHRNLTAANLLVGKQGIALVNFGHAGYGPQLFDVAALLSTAGLAAEERSRLARRYAQRISDDPDTIADVTDLASVAWGVRFLLELPRRQIEVMGDEAGMERILLEATRIHAALREAAGGHPLSQQIRAALWPQ